MTKADSSSSERLAKAQELFDGAVDLPPEERSHLLDQACCGDMDLRTEVESLLASYDDDPDYLDRATDHSKPLLESASEPKSVGPYRILERIGEGGMGAVYLAERDDGHYRHRVAVKLLRRGLDTEQILGRFRAERQILATLDHPRIVRLLDGGVSEDGRPYFVMEHIDKGLPIDRYCEKEELSIRSRLRLFRQVCDAVQHAHQKLIVHRDLKPANLLVSEDAQVKLLDFGIAKLLAPELADVTALALTRPEMRLLTPEYASPEQIRGEPLTAASDVYALGVVLYELLTGTRPHARESRTPAELAEAICETVPERPSTAVGRSAAVAPDGRGARSAAPVGIAGYAGRLRGDLDNIILKALRKEAGSRYLSVEALAADIDRYLDRRPVQARPLTAGYRVRRFVQRNAGGVAAGAAIALALAVGFIGTVWQARLARAERDRAQTEAERSEQVTDVMVGLFDLSDPVRNADADALSVRDFADLAASQVIRDLADRPELLAKMQTAIGRVDINLGRPAEAVELLERALEAQRRLVPGSHLDVAATLHWLAAAKESLGELAEAESLSRQALDMRRELLGEEHALVAESFSALGRVVSARGDLDEAQAHLELALSLRRRLLGDEHEATAESLGALAVVFYERGDYAAAETSFREVIRIKERVLGPGDSRVADDYNDLGAVLYAKQAFEDSLGAHEKALSIRRQVLGDSHPQVAFSYAHIGNVQHLLGDTEAAVENLERSLEIRSAALGAEHPVVAFSLKQLGSTLSTRGEYERAGEMLRRAIEIDRRTYGDNHRLVPHGLNILGRLYSYEGREAEAIPVLREALEIRRAVHGQTHLNTAATETTLARALLQTGEEAEAENLLTSALATYDQLFPEGHLFSCPAHLVLGDLLLSRGQAEEAVERYELVLELRRGKLPPGHWMIAEAESRVEISRARSEGLASVEAGLRRACTTLEQAIGPRHPSARMACEALAGLKS